MAGDVPSSAVDVGGGVLDLNGSNRAHRNDLRARANTLGRYRGEEIMLERRTMVVP